MNWTKKVADWIKDPGWYKAAMPRVPAPSTLHRYLDPLTGPEEQHGLGGDCMSPFCDYKFSPQDVQTSGGSGTLTCPQCSWENDLNELNKPIGAPGGTTRSGLSLKDMGDIRENVIFRLGELPGVGTVTPAGNNYNFPIDAIVESPQGKFGCEIKSTDSRATPIFKMGDKDERLKKIQCCYENGLKPAVIGVRLNFFTSLAYVFFREGLTDTAISNDKMLHVGTFNFQDLNPFYSPDPQAQAQAIVNANLPDQSEDEFAGIFPPLKSSWRMLAAMIDILNEKVAQLPGGGFTIRRTPGRYVVSFAGSEQRVPEAQASGQIVHLYIRTHLARLLEFPDAGVGGWLSGGMMVLDLSRGVDSFEEACEFGIQNHQESIWDSQTGQYYDHDETTGRYVLKKDKQSSKKKSSFDYEKFPKMYSNVTYVDADFFQKCVDELEASEQEQGEGEDEPALVMAAFKEEEHPRDHGRFTFKENVRELKVLSTKGKHTHNIRRCLHCGHLNAFPSERKGREECSTCGEDPDRDLKHAKIVLASREADQIAQQLGFQFFGRTGQGHRKYSMTDKAGTDHTIVVGSGAHGKNAAQIDADRARQRMTRCLEGQCGHIATPIPSVVENTPFVVQAGQTVMANDRASFVSEIDGGMALIFDVETGAEDIVPVGELQAVGGWHTPGQDLWAGGIALDTPRSSQEPFSRHATPEDDPSYLFIYYQGELRTEPYHHNRHVKDMFEDLLKEFNMDLQGSWNDINQSDIDTGKVWADGKVEHENLTDPEVKERAEDALKDWWKEEKDKDWKADPEPEWGTADA